ncbi:MAG: L-histidine N(alpha)-methyltransferase, partial [Spirosoma sp.]|nr:L-histidine N(alpha)-methyltransferase [Spirosoma sp.]
MAVYRNTRSEMTPTISETIEVDNTFADAVRTGLMQTPKRISSRFFYDDEGSRLFEQIMEQPEYYLTRAEYEILDTHKDALLRHFSVNDQSFELVELGAGNGLKTKLLLDYFTKQNADFSYAPVDISGDALTRLTDDVHAQWPDLPLNPRQTDYFDALGLIADELVADAQTNRRLGDRRTGERRTVVMFLGANIGNFAPDEATGFYQQLSDRLRPGDLVLTGFDLQKHPAIISAAYNDKAGVTRAFNLNLLRRINRELGADFDLNRFDHYEIYHPETGEARSYIVSDTQQTVNIDALDLTVPFAEGEIIHTEISRKFTP